MPFSFPGLKRGKDGTKSLNKLLPNTGTPVIAVNSQAKLTIAEALVADDTLTLGDITYTFVTGATSAAGEIGIGANEAASKLAIPLAINGGDGFNIPNPLVTSPAAFTSDVLVLSARYHGVAGDEIVSTETFDGDTNIIDATTFGTEAAGVAGTLGMAGEQKIDDSYLYICMNDGTSETPSSWRRVSLGSAY